MLFSAEKLFQNEKWRFSLRSILHQIFIEDWMMKLFALFITLGLWFAITGLRAPVETRLENTTLALRLPNEIQIVNSPTETVDLVVTGDKTVIAQINKSNLVVSLDLTDIKAGDHIIELSPENVTVDLPSGTKLKQILPNNINIKLENVEQREVPVKAALGGNVADDFEVYNASVIPAKVRIRGPQSLVRSLDFVATEEIDVKERSEDFTAEQVPLEIPNSKITVLDAAVDVFFRIGERRIERLFLVPVNSEGSIKTATVVLYGARSVLANLRTDDLRVEITENEAGRERLNLITPAEIQGQIEIRKLRVNGS